MSINKNIKSFPFIKMHGAGNDFVLFDNRSMKLSEQQLMELTPGLSNRKFGIGSDGVIALQYDETQQADLVMIYKNPDGSDAGMCGNGARCFASYAATLGSPSSFSFRVHDKVYLANVKDNIVEISFPLETAVKKVRVDDIEYLDVYTNTEHIVCSVDNDTLNNTETLTRSGRYLRNHNEFAPAGTNVNFIHGTGANSVSLQTYERGVEQLTLACGTGAIAAALAWHHLQDKGDGSYKFQIDVKGGTLTTHFTFSEQTNTYSSIKLEGPTAFVFEGRYFL